MQKLLRQACTILLRRSILTLAALPDRERGWLSSPRSSMPDHIREPLESYGYQAARARRFYPDQKDVGRYLDVLAWLSWLGQQNDGPRDVRIITARAFGAPFWKLAAQHGKSDETIRRWEAAAIDRIIGRFAVEMLDLANR